MILQFDGALFAVRGVFARGLVPGGSQELDVVLHHYSVVENRRVGRLFQLGAFETRTIENDVVGLEFAGFAAGVNQGRCLAVKCCGLAVWVGFVFVAIQYLDFIDAKEEDSTVAAALAGAFGRGGSRPFYMELNVRAELACAFEITCSLYGDCAAFFDGPVRLSVGVFLKLGKVISIEKHNGIAGSIAWIFPRSDDLGLGAEPVMDMPIGAWDHWSVLVANGFCVLRKGGGCDGQGKEDGGV